LVYTAAAGVKWEDIGGEITIENAKREQEENAKLAAKDSGKGHKKKKGRGRAKKNVEELEPVNVLETEVVFKLEQGGNGSNLAMPHQGGTASYCRIRVADLFRSHAEGMALLALVPGMISYARGHTLHVDIPMIETAIAKIRLECPSR
jgi:hypothetical protein